MHLASSCNCRAQRFVLLHGDLVPSHSAAAVPHRHVASPNRCMWATTSHATGCVLAAARSGLAQGAIVAGTAAELRVAASEPGPVYPPTIEDLRSDDGAFRSGAGATAGAANAEGWREPGQTLSLEASTSPASNRVLTPAPRRSRRGKSMATGTAHTDRREGSGPAPTAADAAAAAAAASAATTKAAAAAAVAAKWRARAAAGATAAAAGAAAVGTGSTAPRTWDQLKAAVLEPAAAAQSVALGASHERPPPLRPDGSSRSSKGGGAPGNSRGVTAAAGFTWAPDAAADLAPPPSAPLHASAAALQRQLKQLRLSGRLAEALDLAYRGISCYPLVRSFWASAASLEQRIGRGTAARRLLTEALRRWPGNPALLLVLGQLLASEGQYDAAADAFREALEREPRNAVVLHAWGTAEAARGDLAAARSRFRAASQADPDMAHSFTSWARLEAAAGDQAAARELFQEGHRADPTHVPLLHAWAAFELDHDKQSAARRLLERALELSPHHVPSWMALGTLEWRQGNPAKARAVFERGLAQVGPRPALLSAMADLELRLMNTKAARELFARLRSTTSRHVPALIAEAKMEDCAGNKARAQQVYKEAAAAVAAGVVRGSEGGGAQPPPVLPRQQAAGGATAGAEGAGKGLPSQRWAQPWTIGDGGDGADPVATATVSFATVLVAWAQSHVNKGDLVTAEQLLLAVESVEPINGHMCHTRGLLCQREGALEAAETWFRRGLGCRASRDGALLCYEGLAELLAFQGRKDDARAVWQAGAAALPTPTSRFLRQAALFEKKERNLVAAAALFADSVRRDPQDYRSWLQWGVFESRQRNWEAAERCFQRGTAVAPGYPYLWLAYVSSLVAQRRTADARLVLQSATRHCPRHAQMWMEWALMEAAAGDAEAARRLFQKGSEVPPAYQHEPLYQAWAAFESGLGNQEAAKRLLQLAEAVAQAQRARRQAAEKARASEGGAGAGAAMASDAGAGSGSGGSDGAGAPSQAAVSA